MTSTRRALQPGTLVPDGPRLWVLDQLQPVAVVLDAGSGEVLDRIGFGEVLAPADEPDWPGGWLGQTTDDGLLVQAPHRDGVALLRSGRPSERAAPTTLPDALPRVRPFWVDGEPSGVEWLHGPGTGAGGLRWHVGWSHADRSFPRPVHAVGVAATGGRRQLLLGHGAAITAVTHRDAVWVALEGRRLLATYTRPVPVALVRLDVPSGAVETVLGPDAVDISSWCWPLVPAPADPWAFTQYWSERVQLQAPRWTVTAEGPWPDTDLVVVLRHRERPGVRLRRRFPLYDELGRQSPPEYVVVHIGEEFATAGLPDVPRGATLWDF